MSILFDRFREPNRGRVPQVKPLPYRRRERRADRRAGKADGLSMLPTDVVNPEPTPTINERIAEFVNAVTAELMSYLDETADWYAELATLESDIEAAKDALAAAQKRWEAAAQPSINGQADSIDVWRIDRKRARLHKLRRTQQDRIAKIEERKKQYHTVRNMHGARALRRMYTYATVLRRVHPYGEHLGDVVHQLATVEHERALWQLIELEQRIRGEEPRIATETSLEGK